VAWTRKDECYCSVCVKPGIDCVRLPREAMFVALPRKFDTMLPRATQRTLPRVDPNRSGSLSRGKGISMCCALSVETVLCLRNSVHQRPHAAAALRCWTRTRLLTHKQTKEFAAQEQLRAAAARNRYPTLQLLSRLYCKMLTFLDRYVRIIILVIICSSYICNKTNISSVQGFIAN
jgi:hypothetical protein